MRNLWLILAVGVVLASPTALLLGNGWFDSGPACDDGFDKGDWERDPKDTGRAIAECDWFDGKPRADVIRALGKPDSGPHRGWREWEIGDAPGIGPVARFLQIRVRDGVVTRSEAEARAT